jgi:hypothetical protein
MQHEDRQRGLIVGGRDETLRCEFLNQCYRTVTVSSKEMLTKMTSIHG